MIGHHIDSDRGESSILDGLAVATPPETLRGLSTLLGLGPLVAACDSLVRRESALMAIDELRSALDGHTGQRGARRLRQAVDLCRPGTDSARETRLRLILHFAGFPEPEVNGVISKAGGRTRFGDLVFRKWWTVVEYEGAHHSEDRTTYTGDIERFEELSEWRFVRVAKEHLVNESSVIRRVDRALRAGGWPG